MCGVGLFTKRTRTCSEFPSSKVAGRKDVSLSPHSDRAFGVEFEFVAQGVSRHAALRDAVKELQTCAERTSVSKSCSRTSECSVYDFCHHGRCQNRTRCSERAGIKCPPSMSWNFITDGSVKPLTAEQAHQAGASSSETSGTPFEIVSPPLSGQSGWQSMTEVLGLVRHVGVQAGPSSGIHIHVNVIGDPPGVNSGPKLSLRGIINVWAAYAKYQHVINDMLSPGRQDNHYSKSLYLGDCDVGTTPPEGQDRTWYSTYPHKFVRRIFKNMFAYRRKLASNSPRTHDAAKDMCNAILSVPGDPTPCKSRYPWQRYFQVNLVPLSKYGTMEFRGHSATYDQERVARWIQFLIAFVDYYGTSGSPAPGRSSSPGADEMNEYFKGSWEEGFRKLARDQQLVKGEDLWSKLDNKIDGSSRAFFQQRVWEQSDKICEKVSEEAPPRVQEFEGQCCLNREFNNDNDHGPNRPARYPQTQRANDAGEFLRWLDNGRP